jgi:protein gp37
MRLQAMGNPRYRHGFTVTLHPDKLNEPSKWKTPKRIFVNSMSDLFHKDVPEDFIRAVLTSMGVHWWHTYQVLTKRSERLAELGQLLTWTPNVWMGVSVEDERVTYRIDHLRQTPAKVRFLSLEPLIGPLKNLNLNGIHWVIVGGESGPGARPIDPDWVREIRDQCREQNVPFFFKQWGGVRKHTTGRELDGETYDEFPVAA